MIYAGAALFAVAVALSLAFPVVALVLNIAVAAIIVGIVAWKFGPLAWELYIDHREKPAVEAWSKRVDEALDRKYAHVIHASSQRVAELDPAPLVIEHEPRLLVDLDALEA